VSHFCLLKTKHLIDLGHDVHFCLLKTKHLSDLGHDVHFCLLKTKHLSDLGHDVHILCEVVGGVFSRTTNDCFDGAIEWNETITSGWLSGRGEIIEEDIRVFHVMLNQAWNSSEHAVVSDVEPLCVVRVDHCLDDNVEE